MSKPLHRRRKMFNFERTQQTIAKNRNARIRSRLTPNGKLRTETSNRDSGSISVAASSVSTGATQLFIDTVGGASLRLGGHEARTLYRVLKKHYRRTGRSA